MICLGIGDSQSILVFLNKCAMSLNEKKSCKRPKTLAKVNL